MHLCPERRVDAVGAFDQRADAAIGIPPVAGDAAAEPDRLRAGSFNERPVQEEVEPAAMDGVLRPPVSRQAAARLRIDVVAVQPDQRPFPRGQADAVEVGFGDAQILEFLHRIGLQVDADAERAHLARRLEHHAGHADLVQRQRGGQPADTAAGDEDGMACHLR